MIVIPAIDLQNGRCVRLFQGDFEQQIDYGDQPAEIARKYRRMGFDHIHIVDLDGARDGRQRHWEAIAAINDTAGLSVQLGGGLRDRATVARWLKAGIRRCVIGSTAVAAPEETAAWIAEFGAERIVLALDVRYDEKWPPVVAVNGWTESTDLTLWQCIEQYAHAGLKHVLCTDIGRDGAMSGPNQTLYREFRQRYPDIALQASGGVRHVEDLVALREIGCAAAIAGRALLDGRIGQTEVASFLPGA